MKRHRAPTPTNQTLRSAALAQALAAMLWIGQAWLLADAVRHLTLADAGMTAILPHAAGIAAIGILRALLDSVGGRLAFHGARRILSDLRRDGVASITGRAPLDPSLPPSGHVAGLLAEQAEAVTPFLQRYVPVRWRLMLVPPAILLVVGWLSWLAALILLVAAPLIPLFMALIGIRAKRASEEQLQAVGGMNGLLMDRLRGLPTIRALSAVDGVADRIGGLAQRVRRQTMAVLRIAFLSSAVLELFSAVGVAMVAVYIGFHLLGTVGFGTWGGQLDLGQGLFILLLAPAFFEPLRELSAVWHDRANGEAAIKSLKALTGAETPPPPAAMAETGDGVTVTALHFAYPGVAPLFQGLDLRIEPGERVALFGPSGCGKSTLLALLAGLLSPDAGQVGRAGAVGWIGHRPNLLNASLSANVTLGRRGLDARPLLQTLLPDHDPARRVGENGVGLSGGELVRLAVARALADPRANLILADEPTAHLDADTARQVVDALIAATAGRTLIVATHDPLLAARMDRIVEMA